MSEELRPGDAGSVWRSQALEKVEVNMEAIISRRTRDLRTRTRTEIIGSIAAALFFATFAAWRILSTADILQLACFALVILWILISVYRYRGFISRRDSPPPQTLAAPAVEHYRRELELRRDHLRNVWIWNGPLFLALLFLLITLGRAVYPHMQQLVKATPFLLALVVWLVFAIRQRRRQVSDVQEELEELKFE